MINRYLAYLGSVGEGESSRCSVVDKAHDMLILITVISQLTDNYTYTTLVTTVMDTLVKIINNRTPVSSSPSSHRTTFS